MTKAAKSRIILSVILVLGTCQPPKQLLTSQSSASYDVGARPIAVAAADLNGDRALDLAVANSADGTVTILAGTAGGQFRPSPGSPFPAGREPSDVDAADMDRDGDVDLVLANHETSGLSILLNDGRAQFTAAPGSPFETGARPHVHSLATADFDGDGWMDVAVDSADTKEIRVIRGGPRGFLAPIAVPVNTMPYNRLGAANVTGDEQKEILVPGHGDNTVRFIQREGAGLALTSWNIRLSDKPWAVAGDDINGDRRTDVIVVQTDAVSIWLAGSEGFSAAPGSPFSIRGATEVATGDLDGDGVAEVAIGPWNGDEVTVIGGRNLSVRKVRTCERPIGLAIADLNGDRRGELLATCANHNRVVVLNGPLNRRP